MGAPIAAGVAAFALLTPLLAECGQLEQGAHERRLFCATRDQHHHFTRATEVNAFEQRKGHGRIPGCG